MPTWWTKRYTQTNIPTDDHRPTPTAPGPDPGKGPGALLRATPDGPAPLGHEHEPRAEFNAKS